MAQEQWDILIQRYSHNDLLYQYELCAWIHLKKLKDTEDALCYLSVFEDAQCWFIQMGVTYPKDEAVFNLFQGLPDIIELQIFKGLTITKLNTSGMSLTTTPSKLFFDEVAKSFSEKGNTIFGKRKLVGPGLEYVNVAITSTTPHVHIHTPAKINPATGLNVEVWLYGLTYCSLTIGWVTYCFALHYVSIHYI